MSKKEVNFFDVINSRTHVVEVFDDESGEFVPTEVPLRLEYPDPIPVEIPLALRSPESTDQAIKRMMMEERAWHAYTNRAEETIADLDDFDLDQFTDEFVSEHELEGSFVERMRYQLEQILSADDPRNADIDVPPSRPPKTQIEEDVNTTSEE